MQPSLILPIILKDLRANRWLFAAFFAVSILSTASSFLNPQNLGPLARSGMVLVYCLFILLALLAMARVVHADPPASDTAFLATRPVSGTTLFFAKLLLVMVALSFIPSAIDAVEMLLLGFETSVDLERSFAPLDWMSMLALFVLCTMTKKLRWFLLWCVVFVFGIGVLIGIGTCVFLIVFVFFPLSENSTWAELAGIYWFVVSGENFENKTVLLSYAIGAMAFFGIIWRQYVRPNTMRSAFLFVGAILITCLIGFVGYRQALQLPSEAKASNTSMQDGYLTPSLTKLHPGKTKITSATTEYGMQVNRTPNMISQFTFSNWPEDVDSMTVSNVAVSFNRDGQDVTTPILPAEGTGFLAVAPLATTTNLRELIPKRFRIKTDEIFEKLDDIFNNHNITTCFSWPPKGLENGLPSTTGDLTLRLDLAVFQYKTQAILPLQVGETAQFGRRIATVRSINPSPRLRSVTLEINEMSVPSFSWAEPVYRLKTGAGLVKASQSERSMISSELSPVERSTVTLKFPMPSTMEQQTDAPLDEEVMSQRIAEWLKDAELVVSKITPAGTIQREMPITGEARMRFLNGARPLAHRAGYARLIFEDMKNVPDDRHDRVGIIRFHQFWDRGGAVSEPELTIHVPAARRGEFEALPNDTARYAWLAKQVQTQMDAGDTPSADGYATLLLHGLGVERNLPQAKILLQDAIKRKNFSSAKHYVQLRLLDPDQPEGVRDAMDLMIPLLEAGHTPILWSTEEVMDILAKSQEESDRALGLQLARSVAQNVKQVYSNQNDESWTKNPNVKDNAKMALDSLIDSSSPQDLTLAEQLVESWLARDPQNEEAKGYENKLRSR